jgi:hypothetical protein
VIRTSESSEFMAVRKGGEDNVPADGDDERVHAYCILAKQRFWLILLHLREWLKTLFA